jgi:hypothetical protein
MEREKCKHECIYIDRTTRYFYRRVGDKYEYFNEEDDNPGYIFGEIEYTCTTCGAKISSSDIDFVENDESECDIID